MLYKRIATAITGIIAAVYIISYGKWVFASTILVLMLLAWHEYCSMMTRRDIKPSYLLGAAGIVLLWATAWLGNTQEILAVFLLAVFAALVQAVLQPARFNIADAVFTIAGISYVGLSLIHLVLLRFTGDSLLLPTKFGEMSAGAVYLWLAFVGTWASDTFAYFVGSKFGRHKLAPAISPAKTWEGTIGGVAGSVLGTGLLGAACGLSIVHSAAIGLLIGVVAPLGDLAESVIKRYTGVKDSGRLLPGHGGVLDRFDSVMFAAPVVYYYVHAFISSWR